MKRKTKTPTAKSQQPLTEEQRAEKVARLAHHILMKVIAPAKLTLEDVVDVLMIVAKGVVLSNTSEDEIEERSEMVGWIQGRFVTGLDEVDPLAEEIPHVWLVAPQGLITEPFGILWSGSYDDDDEDVDDDEDEAVQVVLGVELEALRAEIAENQAGGVIVTEGVDGVAVIDPAWDGEPTMTCGNPACGKVHDVHLQVAENLFRQAIERRQRAGAPN